MASMAMTSGDALPASTGSMAGGTGYEALRGGGGTMVGCWLFGAPPHFETVTGGESRRRWLLTPRAPFLWWDSTGGDLKFTKFTDVLRQFYRAC
mmetsp:Transcript_6572/g.19379  ORF Transcript_6572/g.19379 Transcript_6572/m.19379 type:complete len:94 (+) Transcript_6572:259-540(+)